MRYLIDAYNLFFKIQQDVLPLQKKRETFIDDLDHEIDLLNLHVTLIFDSNKAEAEVFPSSKKMEAIEVVFSPKHLTADQYILELLEWDCQNTTLVTSDRELTRKAKFLGAKAQTIEEFIALIIRKRGTKMVKREEKPTHTDSDANLKRLLKVFEERLSEDENA